MKVFITNIVFISLFILLNGCNEHFFMSNRYESTSTESKVIALNGQTNFTIENTNGNIDVSTSDTAKSIYCKIDKKVKSSESEKDANAHLSDININTTESGTRVKIKVTHPNSDGRSYEIRFNIIMPDNFNYNLNLGNGNISVNSSTKNLTINIGNGNAVADVVLNDNCSVSMSVGNGSIDMKIPGSTNASINAEVGNGSVSNSGLSFENVHSSSRTLSGKLGSGKGSIDLSVGNGSIAVSRK